MAKLRRTVGLGHAPCTAPHTMHRLTRPLPELPTQPRKVVTDARGHSIALYTAALSFANGRLHCYWRNVGSGVCPVLIVFSTLDNDGD